MGYSATDLGFLQTVLRRQLSVPGSVVESRVDRVVDLGVEHSHWRCDHQLYLEAFEGSRDPVALDHAVVSIGIFRKSRLPDLTVRDQSGRDLSVLPRRRRVSILASIFCQQFSGQVSISDLKRATGLAASVMGAQPAEALVELEAFDDLIRGFEGVSAELASELVESLRPFVEFVQILVVAFPENDGRCRLVVEFSRESAIPHFKDLRSANRRVLGEAPNRRWGTFPRRAWLACRWALMTAGVLPAPIRYKLDGANHCGSYYFLVQPPKDLQLRRLYWKRLESRAPDLATHLSQASPEYSNFDSSSAVIGCFHKEHDADGGWSSIDIGVSGQSLRHVFALSAFCSVVLAVIYRNLGHDTNVEFVSVAAVLPGLLLGYFSNSANGLALYTSRWLRRSVYAFATLMVLGGVFVLTDLNEGYLGQLLGSHERIRNTLSDASVLRFGTSVGAGLTVLLGYLSFVWTWLGVVKSDRVDTTFSDVARKRRAERFGALGAVALATLLFLAVLYGWGPFSWE